MSIRKHLRFFASLIAVSAAPQLVAQTPSPAENFNDSVGIFRETTTSDWPALFLSPFTHASQPITLKGLTISISGDSTSLDTVFSLNSDSGIFRWRPTPAGASMELTSDGMLSLVGGGGGIVISPSDGTIFINNSAVLTEDWLSYPLHFAQISAGTGSTATGANAFAAGLGTTAQAPSQFVVGQYNVPSGTTTNPTDPLFIVGNGESIVNTSNAFLVSRNGDTRVAGKLISGNSSLAAGLDATAIGYQANASAEKAIAIGANTHAAGTYANVFGIYCQAHGFAATSIGFSSHATGEFALAIGRVNFATGYNTVSIGGYNVASGYGSLAFGNTTTSSGTLSTTLGGGTNASGTGSLAAGHYTTAVGHYSFAMGNYSEANGESSVALGDHTKAGAYGQFVSGAYNKDSSNALLIVGNGTDADGSGPTAPVRGNAFEVRKDGSVHANVLRVRPAGDISMGDFEDGPEPFDP